MAITQATLGNVPRDPTNQKPHPDRWSVGAWGELCIGGGTALVTAANPSATALTNAVTAGSVVAARDFRVTLDVATGTHTVEDAGEYLVELDLGDFSCGVASGNVQFDVQYAPDGVTFAAFDATDAGGGGRMQGIRAAATAKAGLRIARVQHLNARSKVRAIVTSAAGGAITVTEGALRVTKLSDNNPVSA